MKKGLIVSLIAGLAFCVSQSCFAIPITGLYSTGVDNSGNILPSGTDMHYTPTASGYDIVRIGAHPAWVSTNSAGWVGSSDGRSPFTARLTFNIPSVDNVYSYITGYVTADDVVYLYLNGILVGNPGGYGGYWQLNKFSIYSGFIEGTNTLDFTVYNIGGGPMGLLATNLSGETGLLEPIPEPASVLLMLLSGTGLCVKRFFKKS